MKSLSQVRWHAIAISGLVRRNSCLALACPFETNAAVSELNSFLKALPDCQMRSDVRFQQQFSSSQGSSDGTCRTPDSLSR